MTHRRVAWAAKYSCAALRLSILRRKYTDTQHRIEQPARLKSLERARGG